MALSYQDLDWTTNYTHSGTNYGWKDITVTIATGDLVVATAMGSNNIETFVNTITTQAGPGAVNSWTSLYSAPGAGDSNGTACSFVAARGTCTTPGSITIRGSVQGYSAQAEGVAVWIIPAAEWTGTPAWTTVTPISADLRASLTLSATSTVLCMGGGWTGSTASTGTTPAGGTVDDNTLYSGQYDIFTAHWTAQASGTRTYGTGTDNDTNWVGGFLVVQEAGGGSQDALITPTSPRTDIQIGP